MTSDGSAVIRLQRAISNPRVSAGQIRAIARELPQIGLEDALAILLALLEREPDSFERASARWAARVTIEHGLTLTEAQLALSALAALRGPAAAGGVEALVELSDRCGLRRVERLLAGWAMRRQVAAAVKTQ